MMAELITRRNFWGICQREVYENPAAASDNAPALNKKYEARPPQSPNYKRKQ